MNWAVVCPTNYCNFNCYFCKYKKSNKRMNRKTLSLAKTKKFLEEAKLSGSKFLVITGGGEPLLALKRILQIIELGKNMGFEVRLVTNGFYSSTEKCEEITKKLKEAGLSKITFSIDADHLKFVDLNSLIRAIKYAAKFRIMVKINTINRKDTKKANFNSIKKISSKLQGFLIKISTNKFYILAPKYRALIYVETPPIAKSKYSNDKLNRELSPSDVVKIANEFCWEYAYTLEANGHTLPCCHFNALNNPQLFDLKKNQTSPSLNQILNDKMAFTKFYLKIRNDKKLIKNLNGKVYSRCDFCYWILKHKKIIEKYTEPTRREVLLFLLPRLHIFLKTRLKYLFKVLLMCTARAIQNGFYNLLIYVENTRE